MRIARAASALALTPLLLLGGTVPAFAADTLTQLALLPGTDRAGAADVNDHGVVVGSSGNLNEPRAARWAADGAVTELARPEDYAHAQAAAVNNSGVVVGSAQQPGLPRPVRWDAQGTPALLPLPAGGNRSGYATDVNDAGTAVGWADYHVEETGWQERGLRWAADGALTVLAPLPGHQNSGARAVGPDGTAVGTSGLWGQNHPVRWLPDGTVQALPSLPGRSGGFAEGINADGVIVGSSGGRPVRWNPDGTVTDLGLPPGAVRVYATDVNDAGLITLIATDDRNDDRPVVRELDGTFTVLPGLGEGLKGGANALNGTGTVVGLGGDARSGGLAVRWTR